MNKTAIVVGAGIAGLASAKVLAEKGFSVTVIERTPKATGASIRNFGMIWPIGQPDGFLYDTAIKSLEVWKDVSSRAGLFHDTCGSIHVGTNELEWQTLQELCEIFQSQGREVTLLQADEVISKFPAVKSSNLKGGLFSASEMIIDPRAAIAALPHFFKEEFAIDFIWNTAVTGVGPGIVRCASNTHQADLVVICSGVDFETLYPDVYASLPLTKCKLQMLRMRSADNRFKLGTAICGGLSLTYYDSFKPSPSVYRLKEYFSVNMPDYMKYGIHVMVCQNGDGELTVGDSHEYDLAFDPFDKQYINTMITDYLKGLVNADNWTVQQTWNGVYPKLLDGGTHIFTEAEKDVYIFNGLRGAGMTLSFGLAESLFANV